MLQEQIDGIINFPNIEKYVKQCKDQYLNFSNDDKIKITIDWLKLDLNNFKHVIAFCGPNYYGLSICLLSIAIILNIEEITKQVIEEIKDKMDDSYHTLNHAQLLFPNESKFFIELITKLEDYDYEIISPVNPDVIEF